MKVRRRHASKGQGLVEYALILVLVAIVVIGVMGLLGKQIGGVFCTVLGKLDAKAPSSVQFCSTPRVTISGISDGQHISGAISVEGVVDDDKGGTQPNIQSVEFYLDSDSPVTERIYHFCLAGGDSSPCPTRTFSNGTHTLRVVATDADNNTGETSITFYVP